MPRPGAPVIIFRSAREVAMTEDYNVLTSGERVLYAIEVETEIKMVCLNL